MAEIEIGTKQKLFCNCCKNETHHELKLSHTCEHEEIDHDEDGRPSPCFLWTNKYRFWVCCGCDTATLEDAWTASWQIDKEGNYIWESRYYPKRKHADHDTKYFQKLSLKLSGIYKEIIECFNASLKISCAMGLRALLEGVCADKGITTGKLENKIDQLTTHLPPNIVESLHSFRFMGNVAAHELQAPNREDLKLAIEVIEDLLNFLYELDYKAQQLKKRK